MNSVLCNSFVKRAKISISICLNPFGQKVAIQVVWQVWLFFFFLKPPQASKSIDE